MTNPALGCCGALQRLEVTVQRHGDERRSPLRAARLRPRTPDRRIAAEMGLIALQCITAGTKALK